MPRVGRVRRKVDEASDCLYMCIIRTWSKEGFNLWKGAIGDTVTLRSEANIKECAVMGSHVVEINFPLCFFHFANKLLQQVYHEEG